MSFFSAVLRSIRHRILVMLCIAGSLAVPPLLSAQINPLCCTTITVSVTALPDMGDQCCIRLSGTTGCGPSPFSVAVERMDSEGFWQPIPMSNYVVQPATQQFTMDVCVPQGNNLLRLLFRNSSNILFCVKEVSYYCQPACCYDATFTISPQLAGRDSCCFDIELTTPSCGPCTIGISEMNLQGVWHSIPMAAILYSPGQLVPFPDYCFTHDATPARIRFEFYDLNNNRICQHELTADCHYEDIGGPGGSTGPGKTGTPLEGAAEGADIVQNLAGAPNPATDETLLSFTLTEQAEVGIELVDALGRRLTIQPPTLQAQGTYTLPVNTSAVANGMYTVVVRAGATQVTTTLLIAR